MNVSTLEAPYLKRLKGDQPRGRLPMPTEKHRTTPRLEAPRQIGSSKRIGLKGRGVAVGQIKPPRDHRLIHVSIYQGSHLGYIFLTHCRARTHAKTLVRNHLGRKPKRRGASFHGSVSNFRPETPRFRSWTSVPWV